MEKKRVSSMRERGVFGSETSTHGVKIDPIRANMPEAVVWQDKMILRGQMMQIEAQSLSELAERFLQERKCQGLSREQAAAVCNVSASFIRDAESDPSRCSLALLLQFAQGLGLRCVLTGWQSDRVGPPTGGSGSPDAAAPAAP